MHNVYVHISLIKTKYVALVIVKVILHNLLLQGFLPEILVYVFLSKHIILTLTDSVYFCEWVYGHQVNSQEHWEHAWGHAVIQAIAVVMFMFITLTIYYLSGL